MRDNEEEEIIRNVKYQGVFSRTMGGCDFIYQERECVNLFRIQ